MSVNYSSTQEDIFGHMYLFEGLDYSFQSIGMMLDVILFVGIWVVLIQVAELGSVTAVYYTLAKEELKW